MTATSVLALMLHCRTTIKLTSSHIAGNFARGTAPPGAFKHLILGRKLALLKSLRNIPANPERN
ncbi:hypothetical protein T265_03066 [Opisthorchis viverrini]|uniref:Uncharacterized protein n=1 Tax=Opisthorchis viverrini TaxID=6198 RepID=A0A074ZTK4_OPIVI|nr:hypothetical protein T265_03066 [Opisthorchis viverrini]KER30451.1 hypothetical protein T265_03066 [Opisthorchis viverrini]